MKTFRLIFSAVIIFINISCDKRETPFNILQKTVANIDTINTISFKQEMTRTNPRNIDEIIQNYREMNFVRLREDSIVGVKGHWYFYSDDKNKMLFEDIYDGERLVRKNNRNSVARVFDLNKYPEFKEKHFWSHNTPFSIQYMLKFVMKNKEFYQIERLNDTLLDNTECFHIRIRLENKESMPGFLSKLKDNVGNVSNTHLFINKLNYYPIQMNMENHSIKNEVSKMFFTNQKYLELKFNIEMNVEKEFNTSDELLARYKVNQMTP